MAERLRCERGDIKPRNQFSQRQLDKYDQNRRRGTATAFKTGIHCLEHSSTQNLELKCLGPCRRTRALRFFSKNTRRNGKNVSFPFRGPPAHGHGSHPEMQWCVDCTDWQIKMEVGETLPPPGAQLSVEELESIRCPPPQPRDEMVTEYDLENFDDAEVRDSSSVLGDPR